MMHLEMRRRESGLFTVDTPLPVTIGVAGRNCNSVNYALPKEKIRRYEKHLMHFQTGIVPERTYFLDQEHGDVIVAAESPWLLEDYSFAAGDAMITDVPGNCLVIRTADCAPVFLVDAGNRAVAAVHSGWKSTQKNIVSKTIARMKEKYGTVPSELKAFILPLIGAEHYEVGEDVASLFPGFVEEREGKRYLDLRAAVNDQLRNEGIARNSIFAAWQDTWTMNQDFFSHRKGDAGRNLNFIVIL